MPPLARLDGSDVAIAASLEPTLPERAQRTVPGALATSLTCARDGKARHCARRAPRFATACGGSPGHCARRAPRFATACGGSAGHCACRAPALCDRMRWICRALCLPCTALGELTRWTGRALRSPCIAPCDRMRWTGRALCSRCTAWRAGAPMPAPMRRCLLPLARDVASYAATHVSRASAPVLPVGYSPSTPPLFSAPLL